VKEVPKKTNYDEGLTAGNLVPVSESGEDQNARRGDKTPCVEHLPDGSTRITTRVIRPMGGEVKNAQLKKEQIVAQIDFSKIMAATGRVVSYPNYRNDSYDYSQLMPEIGSPASIEAVPVSPPLVIANVRHLAHNNNAVSPDTQDDYIERAANLVDDLGITENTLVFVISSPAATFEVGSIGSTELPDIHSRTDSTLDVIRAELDRRGITHVDNSLGETEPDNQLTARFRRSLDEFQVSDSKVYRDVTVMIAANMAAMEGGQPVPYPEAPNVPPTVYASEAPSLQDLEAKTGISEVASASVAHGLEGFDILEDHFLRKGNIPANVDKVVVILGRHGQFCTNVSEALLVATEGNHPIAFAENGGYSIVQACLTVTGEVVEDYIVVSGQRTGMTIK